MFATYFKPSQYESRQDEVQRVAEGETGLHTHRVGGRPLHNDFIPSLRIILMKASCK